MPHFLRSLVLACIFLGLTASMIATIAIAKTYHRRAPHAIEHHAQNHGTAIMRTAQTHLAHLGYYKGKIDGASGPKTTAALKSFQRDHHIQVTGMLTTQTYNALVEADMKVPPVASTLTAPATLEAAEKSADFYATHPDFYGYYNQQYADPMLTAPTVTGESGMPAVRSQALPSRYGKLDMSEDRRGPGKAYDVMLNGQAIFQSDNQPSIIGVSRTFQLNDEDAIIFTTYNNDNIACPFKHYLLTLKSEGNNMREIGNCTHGYQAGVKEGSLFVVFPENGSGRVVGNTWRYENEHLERL